MKTSSSIAVVILIASTAIFAIPAAAQPYPTKPIRILTTETGNSTDYFTRIIAQGIGTTLGQQVVVDNRGISAGQITAKASPDGYTLLSYGSPLWLAPYMRSHVPYDPARDFATITLSHRSPNILVINTSVPAKSVSELVALAKAKPGGLNYGSGSAGSSPHLAAELFKVMAGVDIVRIPYKGTGQALPDLIGGRLQLMFASVGSVVQHVKSGKLRALAITSARPSEIFPGLPTVSESGVPGYVSVSPYGLFAPAKTATVIISRLNKEMVTLLQKADVREKFFSAGAEPVGSSPQEFAATVKDEMTKLGKLIKDFGIRDE